MLHKTDKFSPHPNFKTHTYVAHTHTEHTFLLCRVFETLIGMIEDMRIACLVTLKISYAIHL